MKYTLHVTQIIIYTNITTHNVYQQDSSKELLNSVNQFSRRFEEVPLELEYYRRPV